MQSQCLGVAASSPTDSAAPLIHITMHEQSVLLEQSCAAIGPGTLVTPADLGILPGSGRVSHTYTPAA